MANYLLKKFSDRSFNISLSRSNVGEVRLMPSGRWMGALHGKVAIHNFLNSANAFHAVVLAYKVSRLPEPYALVLGNAASEHEELNQHNAAVRKYVSEYNRQHDTSRMRVRSSRR